MKKKHIFILVVVLALCASLILPFVTVKADAQEINNFDVTNFEGKKISIIGDSISTYEGVSNNTAYNSTIGGNAVYYGGTSRDDWATKVEPLGVERKDTWWQQTIDTLGMELCVNNSWSGSKILNGTNANSGCVSRCTQLHNTAGEKPDIIVIFLGTNDCNELTDASKLGTPGTSMFNTVKNQVNNTSFAPSTILGAYSLMVYRAMTAYPDAEIYCMTLQHKLNDGNDANRAVYEAFNAGVKQIVEYYKGTGEDIYLVDLYNNSGMHGEKLYQEYCLLTNPANSLHPMPVGMDSITNCLISSMLKNSKYMTGTRYTVSYDLDNVFVEVGNMVDGEEMFGDVTTVMGGKPFRIELGTTGTENIDVKVTMGGKDISTEAVHGDVITIDNVTGDIEISATEFDNFYWEFGDSGIITNPDYDADFSYNEATVIGGTYSNGILGASATDGDVQIQLAEAVNLLHDRPWVVEFEAQGKSGGGFASGILLTSDTATSSGGGNAFIHLTQSQVLMGYRDHINAVYANSGINFTTIATKIGSSAGAAVREEKHVYRLVNVVNADGSNMIDLYVDGKYVGAMNEGTTHGSVIAGKDFIINYFGSSNHPLQNCRISYFKAYENGVPATESEINNFRWNGVGESLTTEADGSYFTENVASIEMGTGVNGVQKQSTYSLDKPITLLHDRPWNLEWKAKGSYAAETGTGNSMFMSTMPVGGKQNAPYIYRTSGDLLAFGIRNGSSYYNYGISIPSAGITLDDNQFYVYRLENRITYNTDGTYASNMIYLYIDDTEVGAMNNSYIGSTSQNATSDWVSGKDFVFSYFGVPSFPVNNVTIDYIQVWENGSGVNTARLEYLVNNALEKRSDYTTASWNAYNAALTAAESLLTDKTISQSKVDEAVAAIMDSRSKVVASASATKIYSVELVTGGYARVGKQTGLRIITSPDVAQIGVGSETLILSTGQVQELLIEDVKTTVKVWLVTFKDDVADNSTATYVIGAYTDPNVSNDTANKKYQASTSIVVPYKSRFAVSIAVTTMPTKTAYVEGELFETAGMVVEATMNDGTTVVISERVNDGTPSGYDGYFVHQTELKVTDTYVTVEYDGVTVTVPITVTPASQTDNG